MTKRGLPKNRWERTRRRILIRDGYSCQIKGAACTQYANHVDHITPRFAGGTDDDDNLQAACRNCNLLKGK